MGRIFAVTCIVAVGIALGLMANEYLAGAGEPTATGSAAADNGGATAGESQSAQAARPENLTISVSGDILIHSPVWQNALANGKGQRYDFAPMFAALRPYVKGADLAICHLETPVTSAAPSGYPIFSAPLDLIKGIKQAGWDACDTASNHSLDQGQAGIDETVAELRRLGLAQTGSYRSEAHARRPVIVRAGSLKLALLAYTDQTNGIPPPQPWSVALLPAGEPAADKADRVAADVERAAKAGVDAALVLIQWGDENSTEPNQSQIELARAVTRIPRVLAIAGQGPHVVQPIRRIRDKFVIFSSGNLLSNQSARAGLPDETQNGLVALLRVVVGDIGSADPPPGAVRSGDRFVAVRRVDYVPTRVRLDDHLVEPVGVSLRSDPPNAAELRGAWDSTVTIVGRGSRIAPIPRQ